MPPPEVIYISSDNLIEVTGVLNVATNTYLNSATVTVRLVDAATSSDISGQSWPLTLTYVAASNGDYRGTLSDDLVISGSQNITAQVTVDGGAGLKRYWEVACIGLVGD